MAFTCPRCHATSYHPEDERHGYCGNCHDFTASPSGNLPNAGDTPHLRGWHRSRARQRAIRPRTESE